MTWLFGSDYVFFITLLVKRMMVTGGAKIDCFIKSDSLLTINPVCLYRLVLAPAATVYYHVKRTIYIKRECQIPQWFPIIFPTLFRTATAA